MFSDDVSMGLVKFPEKKKLNLLHQPTGPQAVPIKKTGAKAFAALTFSSAAFKLSRRAASSAASGSSKVAAPESSVFTEEVEGAVSENSQNTTTLSHT